MMNSQLIVLAIKAMTSVLGFDSKTYMPQSQETAEEREARFTAIASDLYKVVSDENEAPLYPGEDGRIKTYFTILSIASFESSFLKNVDYGLGSAAKGDHGRSVCLAQINIGGGKIKLTKDGIEYSATEGYSANDLTTDRQACFRVALHIARMSFNCGNADEDAKLQMYASGKCDSGYRESRNRIRRAMKWYGEYQETKSAELMSVNEKDVSGK